MLLYSLLHLTGYGVTLDDLESFRQWGSQTPGHPEYGLTPGVEATTGPLGQGFANAVGMAIAERRLAREFNRPGHDDRRPLDVRALLATATSRRASPRRRRRSPATSACGKLVVALRRQPHPARRADRRWPGRRTSSQAVRGLRLARPAGRGRQRRRGDRRGDRRGPRRRPAEPDRGPDPHRLRQPEQAGHAEGPRPAARRRRGPARQGGLRLGPGRSTFYVPDDALRALPRGGAGRRGARRGVGRGDGRLRRRPPGPRRGAPAPPASPAAARRLGRRPARRTPTARRSRPGNASQDAIQALAGPVPELFGGAADLSRVEPDRRQGRRRLRGRRRRPERLRSASASTRWAAIVERDRLPRRLHPVRGDVPRRSATTCAARSGSRR